MTARLQLVALVLVGVIAVLALVGAVVLSLDGEAIPDFLVATVSLCVGAIAGALTLGKASTSG